MCRSNTENEENLLHLIQQGDEQAMHALYCRYVRYLTAVCSRYICCDEDVKDVLQEAFLKIFASVGSFEYRGAGSLKGWMTKIVLNETMKFVKRNARLDFVELEGEKMEISANILKARYIRRTAFRDSFDDKRVARRLPADIQPLCDRGEEPPRNCRIARNQGEHLRLAIA